MFGLQVDTWSRVMGLAKGGQHFSLQGRIDRGVT